MSINRLLTRLSVVAALNNHMRAPWPTLAGPNIFDSKIEPVEDMATDRAFPCCVVYTDYDKDHMNKAQKLFKDRLLTVTLELLIVQVERYDGEGEEKVYQLECPVTDSEVETSLDLFEVQIFRALSAGTAAADVFNYLCPAYENAISRRGASVEGGQRLAARQLTLEMKALRDNVSGTIPPEVGAFLAELEQFNDYADRVGDIRDMITAPASWTPGMRLMNRLGYSRAAGDMLGAPVTHSQVLPPNLVFLNPSGGAFP